MKDNLPNEVILNRKLIIELRFSPISKLLDIRGAIIDALISDNILSEINWRYTDLGLTVIDATKDGDERNRLIIESNRLSFISTKIDTIESFITKFEKIYTLFKDLFGIPDVKRIGARIIGTYKCKSENFDDILLNFKQNFKNDLFVKDYEFTDLRFHLVYKSGMYQIGPINKSDNFIKQEFPFKESNNSIGFAIDTDNYYIKTTQDSIASIGKIKDVLIASLAVEKDLFEKIKNY